MYRMPYFPASPVASGHPYHVIACRGRVPTSLAEFAGVAEFVLSTRTGTMRVRGVGTAQADWVRFQEKDAAGRDGRVWHITLEADGGFTAATGPSIVLAFGWPLDRWPTVPA
jgi:hypothetical protein